jgi:hypothetical protein
MIDGVACAQIGDLESEQRDSRAALFKSRDRFPNGPFGERTLHKKKLTFIYITLFFIILLN